jgi:hypothetical protein
VNRAVKKILIIGSADSVFVKDFVTQISTQDVIIDLITFSGLSENKKVRNEVRVEVSSKGRFGLLTRQIELFLKTRRALRQMDRDYDAIVLHFIFFFLAPHVFFMRKITKNIVSVIWGSDFYRSGRMKSLIQKVIYRFSTSIVFTNPATKDEFKARNKTIPNERLKIARFGLPVLDEVERVNQHGISRSEICSFFGFPAEKVLVFVGYSANLSQQQILVVEEFAKLNEATKSRAALIFTLGYGDSSAESKIRESLSLNEISEFVILKQFYGPREIAKIRCATDVLINIQPSDQFSGSMQETLYAGGRVIAGDWLPYGHIINAGAKIRSIRSPGEIGGAMKLEIDLGVKSDNFPNEATREFIETSSSWKENLKIWNSVIFHPGTLRSPGD